MIYGESRAAVEQARICWRKWRLRSMAVSASFEEAGGELLFPEFAMEGVAPP